MGGPRFLKVADLLTPLQKHHIVKLQSKIIAATNHNEIKKYTAELQSYLEEVKNTHAAMTPIFIRQQEQENVMMAALI